MMKRSLLLAVFMTLAVIPAAHADNVRAAQRDGYGRVVFDWDLPIRYAAEVVNGTLVVQFERPVTRDIASVAQSLTQYLSLGRFSNDRRTVYFPLKPNVTMRTFTVGNAVVVDLVTPGIPGQPRAITTTPAPSAPGPAAGPSRPSGWRGAPWCAPSPWPSRG